MAPGALEQLLRGLAPRGSSDLEQRVIAGRARNEDAVVVRMPAGKAIVQTVDILAPIVNDAFWFGRIAACNALSDVYALGGQPWCAMNVAFFPACLTENASRKTSWPISCAAAWMPWKKPGPCWPAGIRCRTTSSSTAWP